MAVHTVIALAAVSFHNAHFVVAAVAQDFRLHSGACHERRADRDIITIANEEHFIERQALAGFGIGMQRNFELGALFELLLGAGDFHDGEHAKREELRRESRGEKERQQGKNGPFTGPSLFLRLCL